MKFCLFVFAFFIATIVHGEYRVFVLKISKPSPEKGQPAIERTVQSSLDPVQYRDLYPVQPDEQIRYADTWRCPGRTDNFQDYCQKPSSAATATTNSAATATTSSSQAPSPDSQKAQIPDPVVSNQNSP